MRFINPWVDYVRFVDMILIDIKLNDIILTDTTFIHERPINIVLTGITLI